MSGKFAKGTKLGLKLVLRSIPDLYIRDALQEIQDYLNQQDILRGVWRKVTFEFKEAGTFTVKHNQYFVPCDFLVTGLLGAITNATINHNTVTEESFEITVDGPGTVRMLIGNVTDFDTR